MISYVVDASIVADFLVPGRFTANVEALITAVDTGTRLIVPEFCLVECANVLWKRVSRKEITPADAERLAQDLRMLPLTLVSVKTLLTRALQIGVAHKLAVYDCVYIALAEQYGYPLITADAKQEAAAQTIGVTLKPITEF